jgi:mannose/fructose/N-acetylgalactosamine-specific phosphotransferase system component IIC
MVSIQAVIMRLYILPLFFALVAAFHTVIPTQAEAATAMFSTKRTFFSDGVGQGNQTRTASFPTATGNIGTTSLPKFTVPQSVIKDTTGYAACVPGICRAGYPMSTAWYSYWNLRGSFRPNNPYGATMATTVRFPTTMGYTGPPLGTGNPVTPTTTFDGRYDFLRRGSIMVTPGPNRFGGTMQFFYGPNQRYYQLSTVNTASYHQKNYGYGPPSVSADHESQVGEFVVGRQMDRHRFTTYLYNRITTGDWTPNSPGDYYIQKAQYISTIVPFTTGMITVWNLAGTITIETHTGYDNRTPDGLSGVVSLVRPRLVHTYAVPPDPNEPPVPWRIRTSASVWRIDFHFTGAAASPTPTATASATPTPTPSATPIGPTETPTATPIATPTATPIATPTATPTATASASPSPTPTPSATPTAAPLPPGSAVGWGYDGSGSGQATPPDAVNGVSGTATDVAAGNWHSCAIQAGTGEVACWGSDDYGQATPPDAVNGVSGTATHIAAGTLYNCAIQAGTGEVVCWGLNNNGQATPPDAVNGVSGTATDIAAGIKHSCAIQAGKGKVVCWGLNNYGQATPPDAVAGNKGAATDIAVGGYHSCAIEASTGEVVCWGGYDYGSRTPPDAVNGVSGTATDIATGDYHSCAIQAGTGNVVCWGRDSSGQATPSDAVNGVAGTATDIATGGDYSTGHSCAIQTGTGEVVCWGDDSFRKATPPDAVSGVSGIATAIAAGRYHNLAIVPEPTAWLGQTAGFVLLCALHRSRARRRRRQTQQHATS